MVGKANRCQLRRTRPIDTIVTVLKLNKQAKSQKGEGGNQTKRREVEHPQKTKTERLIVNLRMGEPAKRRMERSMKLGEAA